MLTSGGADRVCGGERSGCVERVPSRCRAGAAWAYRVYTEQVYRAQVPSGCAERVCRPARSSSQSQAAQGRRCPAPRAERAEARARAARGSASPRARHVASRGTRPSHRAAHRMRACGAKARGIRAARPKLLGVRRTYRSATAGPTLLPAPLVRTARRVLLCVAGPARRPRDVRVSIVESWLSHAGAASKGGGTHTAISVVQVSSPAQRSSPAAKPRAAPPVPGASRATRLPASEAK